MSYLTVRLTPWARERIARDYLKSPDRMTKAGLRASMAAMPDTEFHTVERGQVVTTREALAVGVTVLEVRFNSDRDVAMIDCRTNKVT